MTTVVLTIHVLIVLALIGVVLLQRSEGGALGMGGGGGGGFMSGRGAANALTRTTSVLAALFFATSMALAIFADRGESDESVIEELTRGAAGEQPAPETLAPGTTNTDDLLRSLGAEEGQQESPDLPAAGQSPDDLLDSLGADAPAESPAPEATGDSSTEAAPAAEDAAPADETAEETPPETPQG